ncbi:MAG: hypothetical protein EOP88_22825 [Verrucomicrobiaceae bacterium]|nr:MAG: hypothetical protein EOP88_22825 [Verrucomicrobiaceae bacterium]
MRLDTVTAEIRPRSDWEAADLGFAMVRRSFWRCITVWWLAMGIPLVVAGALLWEHPILVLALFWWCKPAGARMVLFEMSRRLFGEEPSWRSVWREIPRAWWRRFFYRFVVARFSPWMPVTLAVEDLEGLRGKAYRQRCGQVVRRGEGVVMWLYFIADAASAWLGLAILALVMMLMPEGQDAGWQEAVESWDPSTPMEIPLLITRWVTGCVMVAISLTDVFVTGAGFGIYINNRTWIEGWDVELAFRRLAQRLGNVAAVLLGCFLVAGAVRAQDSGPLLEQQSSREFETGVEGEKGQADAEPPSEPEAEAEADETADASTPAEEESPADAEANEAAERIEKVKADPAFKVHTVKTKVPKSKKSSSGGGPPLAFVELLMTVFGICAVALLLGLVGWLIWKFRHVFKTGARVPLEKGIQPTARVVMGMEVSPDTLPSDVPTAAWALWQNGRHQEALGLLYRGSISKVMEIGRVEIHESDTEGDCMRRVEVAGPVAHPDYFRGITGVWIRLAYAGITPADSEVEVLCAGWPFGKGGRA